MRSIVLVGLLLSLLATVAVKSATAGSYPIKTFSTRVGGDKLASSQDRLALLAKFDILLCQRFHYDDINSNSWGNLKRLNPDIEIFLYQYGDGDQNMDTSLPVNRNCISRWHNPDGHSTRKAIRRDMYPTWFLKDNRGADIYHKDGQLRYLMDIGAEDFQNYWIESTKLDICNRPWAADGVFIDHMYMKNIGAHVSPNYASAAIPAKYPSDASWNRAMRGFISSIASELRPQKVITNSGPIGEADGYESWVALDSGQYTRPYGMMEEDGFTAASGTGDTYVFLEKAWKLKVDALKNVKGYKILHQSRTKLKATAATGKTQTISGASYPMGYWDAFWYSLGSYLLGRNNSGNAYFYFLNSADYNWNLTSYWADEYGKIDLGPAVEDYKIRSHSVAGGKTVRIYSREFENGYVYINPCWEGDVNNLALPTGETLRLITHETVNNDRTKLPVVTTIDLPRFRAAILLKDKSISPPKAPANLVVR